MILLILIIIACFPWSLALLLYIRQGEVLKLLKPFAISLIIAIILVSGTILGTEATSGSRKLIVVIAGYLSAFATLIIGGAVAFDTALKNEKKRKKRKKHYPDILDDLD